MGRLSFRKLNIDGLNVFYRESGQDDAPAILLLPGFPTASHMFRDLVSRLSDRFRVVAPDFPGIGQSDMPSRNGFCYIFAKIADVIDRFVESAGLDRCAMYIFDYGSPIGFRLAVKHPERVTAIISRNGNAYEEGLSDGWNPIRAYWRQPTQAYRDALRSLLSPETTLSQYTHGVDDPAVVSPDGHSLDDFYMVSPGAHVVQLDLLLDYADNVALCPVFQNCLRTYALRLLAVWGKNDPFFLPAGAQAFKRDVPGAVVGFVDTGHFALETHVDEIVVRFVSSSCPTRQHRGDGVQRSSTRGTSLLEETQCAQLLSRNSAARRTSFTKSCRSRSPRLGMPSLKCVEASG